MRKMKRLLIFMLFGALLIIPPISRAQTTALDSIQVNLEVKDMALREALQQLVSQTKVQLVYPDALVAGVKTSCSLKNVTLRQALEAILTPAELTYRIMEDGQIVIIWRGWMEGRLENGSGSRPPLFGMGAPYFIDMTLQELNLSKTQKAQIDSAWRAHREKAFELFRKRQNGDLDFEGFRSAHHEMDEDMMKQMQGILTKEQYKKFDKAIEQHRPPGGGFPPPLPHRPEGGAPPPRPPRRR